jgi:hypothetical protein
LKGRCVASPHVTEEEDSCESRSLTERPRDPVQAATQSRQPLETDCYENAKASYSLWQLRPSVGTWLGSLSAINCSQSQQSVTLRQQSESRPIFQEIDGAFQRGQSVRIAGLQGRPELNDLVGKLVRYDAGKHRRHLKLQCETVQLRPATMRLYQRVSMTPCASAILRTLEVCDYAFVPSGFYDTVRKCHEKQRQTLKRQWGHTAMQGHRKESRRS